jgi:YD repeat-containing protein
VEYTQAYQLTSDLGSATARFREPKFVPEVQGHLLVPEQGNAILGVASLSEEASLGLPPTRTVLWRDGRQWRFNEAGQVIVIETPPLRVIYRRDVQQRIQRIEGWYGAHLRADIQLAYDAQGRLVSARGSNGQAVTYAYDATGFLTTVKRPDGVLAYAYQDALVTAVQRDGQNVQQFTYADHGRLVATRATSGLETTYQVTRHADGLAVTATGAETAEVAFYDAALRPLYRVLEDGTHVQWHYAADGTVDLRRVSPHGEATRVSRSGNGQHETWQLPAGGRYTVDYDAAGRPVHLRQGDRDVLQQEWQRDGRLARVVSDTTALHPQYRADGVLTGVLLTPPQERSPFTQWVHIAYDAQGRPAQVTDATGLTQQVGTPPQTPALSPEAGTKAQDPEPVPGQTYRLKLSYDAVGRVVGVSQAPTESKGRRSSRR